MDEVMAKALVNADITLLEELAYVPVAELLAIDGVEESAVHEFRQRARAYLLTQALEGQELPPGALPEED
jgi:N utilization substance protein A